MLGKIIFILIIVGLIYFLILPKFRTKKSKGGNDFVECELCGTFENIDDLVIKDGKYTCKDCIKKEKR